MGAQLLGEEPGEKGFYSCFYLLITFYIDHVSCVFGIV